MHMIWNKIHILTDAVFARNQNVQRSQYVTGLPVCNWLGRICKWPIPLCNWLRSPSYVKALYGIRNRLVHLRIRTSAYINGLAGYVNMQILTCCVC